MTIARPYPERIAELERNLEITRQQYRDADHALRLVTEDRNRLRVEIGTLRFEATQMLAENANHVLALDSLRTERAWLKDNARQQAERILELEAGVEQMRAHEHSGGDGWWKGWDMLNEATGQHDLPPTRAEAFAVGEAARDELVRQAQEMGLYDTLDNGDRD